jgi:hypothetical protein
MNDAPFLYLVFNRPDLTAISFESIKKVKPQKLYVAADGPRKNIEGDLELCTRTREIVINGVDWPCEIHTLFREENLGCKESVGGALDWFFTHEDKGIIIEDDILISDAFIKYSNYLLNKYYDDDGIFSINGNSIGYDTNNINFGKTNYFNMWGWATWRRSWIKVKETWQNVMSTEQVDINNLTESLRLFSYVENQPWFDYWMKIFTNTKDGKIDTWDYQWLYTALINKQKSIFPTKILVQNIGFNSNATHTKEQSLSYRLGRPITLQDLNYNQLELMKCINYKDYNVKHVLHFWNMFDINAFQIKNNNLFIYILGYLELMRIKRVLKD